MKAHKRCIGCVAVVVDDYDRAIEYYTETLGFTLIENTPLQDKRWVLVTPDANSDCNILLTRASNDRKKSFIGNQCGGTECQSFSYLTVQSLFYLEVRVI